MISTIKAFADICKKEPIALGRQMENNYRQIIFDCSGFSEPITDITLVHQRSQDAAPYIVASTTESPLVWTIDNTDTAYYGYGKGELRISFASGLAKSASFQTLVVKSITADTEIPDPLQSWYDAMIDYINEHSITDDQLAQAIEDYIAEHPIEAPVQSVNGQTGAVVLTASDVGAYTKPSGGIPKTDLTASVQTSLNKADTALQSAPVTSVNSKTGAVNLNASDVGALPSTYAAPVTSVDGKTGAVQIMPSGGTAGQVLTKTASGTAWQTVSGGGAVDSVNGQTGTVVLDADDVGALPDDTAYVASFNGATGAVTYVAPVTSVNAKTGAVTVAEIFWCVYGTTTSSEIEAAIGAGKLPMVTYQDYTYTLRYRNSATNHRFVCNYGGKEKSIACQSGTWIPNGDLTFLNTSYTPPVTSVNGATGAVVINNATTSAAGLMSATDKSHLDDVYADYSSALTALGVI